MSEKRECLIYSHDTCLNHAKTYKGWCKNCFYNEAISDERKKSLEEKEDEK